MGSFDYEEDMVAILITVLVEARKVEEMETKRVGDAMREEYVQLGLLNVKVEVKELL